VLGGLAPEEHLDHRHEPARLPVSLHWSLNDCTILPNCGEFNSFLMTPPMHHQFGYTWGRGFPDGLVIQQFTALAFAPLVILTIYGKCTHIPYLWTFWCCTIVSKSCW